MTNTKAKKGTFLPILSGYSFKNTITIDGKKIGMDQPCYILAEIGINHNGEVSLAKKLIDMAVDAGADAVKFQKRI